MYDKFLGCNESFGENIYGNFCICNGANKF